MGLLVVPLLTMTACGPGTASAHHAGTPSGAPPASTSSGPSHAPSASSQATLPAGLVLGPTGLGPLHFGMTTRQATATGMLATPATRAPEADRCTEYPLTGGTVQDAFAMVSPDRGVVVIAAPRAVRTPQHIGAGSTLAQVQAAYPKLAPSHNGTKVAPVPGNPAAQYRFAFDGGTVLAISMMDNQDCAS
ncbi:hypothetical protein [Actinocatenispora thailandica]|uniref:hypothetical protein n=1 Tax=Actinocatenispora thailandica TaxID=227318 RepID=UPI00194F995C|nr:hypothetical protein [Actinocatenispora thailandica]